MNESKRKDTDSGSGSTGLIVAIMIMLLALLIGSLYRFVYVPEIEARDAARREASQVTQDAVVLRSRISELEAMLAELRRTTEGLAVQVQEKETELSATRSTQTELVAMFQQEIADGQIQVERLRDNLRVDLVNEILFNSGAVALNEEGIDVLRRVGEVLNRATDKQIIVQGHTDNVQIGGRLAERFATNWELSTTRAVNVVRFLQDEVGIDPYRLSAVGFSEFRPRQDNATVEGRQINRRIEILLAPLPNASP